LYSLAALRNGCDVVCVEPNAKLVTLYAYIHIFAINTGVTWFAWSLAQSWWLSFLKVLSIVFLMCT